MKTLGTIVLLLLLCGVARAGAPVGGDDWLRMSKDPVVVVMVHKVDDEKATHAHPPVLTLEITEVLRAGGGLKAGQRLKGLWLADGQGGFYAQRDGGQEGLEKWQRQRMSGPETGTRWILLGSMNDGQFRIDIRPRYPFSAEARQHALDLIKQGSR